MFNQISKLAILLAFVVAVSGCATSPNSESTGEYIDSAAITAKVKAELALADETSALNIEVETYKDVVILSGFVDSEEVKAAAQQIAEGVDGVIEVKNALVIKS